MNHAVTHSKSRSTIAAIGPRGPVVPAPPPPPAHDEADPVYDALTDLFLGDGCMAPVPESVPGATGSPTAGVPPCIEALVLGHLPVLASAWVGQYAKHAAQALGRPVALLRVRAGSIALDLVGGAVKAAERNHEPRETLEEALRDVAAHTERWILSVEATNEPRVASMLGAGGIDMVTLLTGADEAAVVACYRTIKSLLGRPDGGAAEDEAAPQIQLGVMGAPPDKANEAGGKLAQAAETFLGRRPDVVACVSKIGGAVSQPLYRGSDERTVEDMVAMIRRTRAVARPQISEEMAASARITPSQRPEGVAPPAPAPAATAGRIGLPLSEVATNSATERPARLTAHIAGLTPIAFRCPYVARVELAKSPDGRLHLLSQAEDGIGLGAAVAHVAGAGAWARVHADLLAAACPGLVVSGEPTPPILHVFTDRAPDARSLLDSEVRVHLLTQARVNGALGWVCVDLN